MGILKTTTCLLTTLLILTGCGAERVTKPTTPYSQKVLQSYLGVSELDLIRAWGVPQSSYTNNGVKFILYKASHTSVSSTYSAPTYWYGDGMSVPIFDGESKTTSKRNWCEVTFEISNKIVSHVKWNGNSCYELTSKAGVNKNVNKDINTNNKDYVF